VPLALPQHLLRKKKLNMHQLNQEILGKYADLMVNFAAGGGEGVKAGEVVSISYGSGIALPLAIELSRAATKVGALIIDSPFTPGMIHVLLEGGNEEQVQWLSNSSLAREEEINHLIQVAPVYPQDEFEGITQEQIRIYSEGKTPIREIRANREAEGNFAWTLCRFPTQEEADLAGISLEKLWEVVIAACYLNELNPVEKWKEIQERIKFNREKLDKLGNVEFQIKNKSTDLTVQVGENRRWNGGSTINMPSFEVWTSPDYRSVNGYVYFNTPRILNGKVLKGVKLVFVNGVVTEATAEEGLEELNGLIGTNGCNIVGELAFTDKTLSNISDFTANTLYDENMGGFHLALGRCYPDTYTGDSTNDEELAARGFSGRATPLHVDFVSTEPVQVTAKSLDDSTPQKELVIIDDGIFVW